MGEWRMRISTANMRVSFLGGGTDYKAFYKDNGSFIVGTSIDKHVSVLVRRRPKFIGNITNLSYSKQEQIPFPSNPANRSWRDEIEHPLIREGFKYYEVNAPVDFHTFSDIPSRCGLGGSSAFSVAMFSALRSEGFGYYGGSEPIEKQLAKDAIFLERQILKESGGIQDAIWAAYGGLNTIEIGYDGDFKVKPVPISKEFKKKLESSCVLVYTGQTRGTSDVAESYEEKISEKRKMKNLAHNGYERLIKEDLKGFAECVRESWEEKKSISPLISTEIVEEISDKLMGYGCYGFKLCGSGNGGMVLGIGEGSAIEKVKRNMTDRVLNFRFEEDGVKNVLG